MSATQSMINLNQSKPRRGDRTGWPGSGRPLERLNPAPDPAMSPMPLRASDSTVSLEEGAALLEVVSRLYHSSAETFPTQLLTGLGRLIPFEWGGCHAIDREDQLIMACYQPKEIAF